MLAGCAEPSLSPSCCALLGAAPPAFRGCDGSSPPEVALPPTPPDAGVCAFDTDCPSPGACADVRCLAGACVVVAGTVDRDRDGEPAAPCGADCDDGDPTTYPGAPEACNGRDDDCDGRVDDDAPPALSTRSLAGLEPASTLVTVGDALLLASGAGARPLDRFGRVGAPLDVFGARTITHLEAATAPDGRAVLAAATTLPRPALLVATLSPDTPPAIAEPLEIPGGSTIRALAVTAHRGGFAVAWVETDDLGASQLRVLPGLSATATALTIDVAVAALASDGDALAFPEPGGIGFLDAAGARTAIALPGTETTGHGLAGGGGYVVALTGTTTLGYALRRVTRAGGAETAASLFGPPEVGDGPALTRLARVGERYLGVEASPRGLLLARIDATSSPPEVREDALPPRPIPARNAVARVPGVTLVLHVPDEGTGPRAGELILITDCVAP